MSMFQRVGPFLIAAPPGPTNYGGRMVMPGTGEAWRHLIGWLWWRTTAGVSVPPKQPK